MLSQLVYAAMCCIPWLFAKRADNTNRTAWLWGAVILLSLISGLRAESVGIDTQFYYDSFINDFPYAWQFSEVGFRAISRILMSVFQNPTILMCLYALATNALILFRLWDFRDDGTFTYMIFFYETVFFIESMNIMRQFIAIAIIFFATRYLNEKKYILYVILLGIAVSIHTTALMGTFFLVAYIWINATGIQRQRMIIPLLLICIFIIRYILYYEQSSIDNYLQSSNQIANINITYIYRVLIFLLALGTEKFDFVISIRGLKNVEQSIFYLDESKIIHLKSAALFYAAGLSLTALGMFFNNLSRVGYYYLLFEVVFWGMILKNSRSKQVLGILSIIYALYIIMYEFAFNGSGVFPYYWIIFS